MKERVWNKFEMLKDALGIDVLLEELADEIPLNQLEEYLNAIAEENDVDF